MSLVNMKDLVKQADQEDYAIGSFSVANMEMVMGVVRAAEELRSPIILQVAEGRLRHSPLELIGPVMLAAARKARVPVAVHLDHGMGLPVIRQALELGFTSIMYDGSHLALEENIQNTRAVLELAAKYGAAVEAEIGRVGRSEDGSEEGAVLITAVAEAERFYEETGVDLLAVAIGNAHGVYHGEPQLHFDRLQELDQAIPAPLVLHGGSGIGPDDFRQCIRCGIKKINVATATFNRVVDQVRQLFRKDGSINYFTYHQQVIEAAYASAKQHLVIFNSGDWKEAVIE